MRAGSFSIARNSPWPRAEKRRSLKAHARNGRGRAQRPRYQRRVHKNRVIVPRENDLHGERGDFFSARTHTQTRATDERGTAREGEKADAAVAGGAYLRNLLCSFRRCYRTLKPAAFDVK